MAQQETKQNNSTSDVLADITDQTRADDAPGDLPTDIALLREQLEEAELRADSEHEAYLRARADFANYKRRTDEEKERMRAIVNEGLLSRLLPIVDNFERAVQAAQNTQDYEKLIGGVIATLKQMQEFLVREGVTTIESVGQPFDPNYHNAVMRYETTEYPENTVVEELQKGYTLGERVLRPSMVKVATGAD